MKYFVIWKGDNKKEEITREDFVEKISKGRDMSVIIEAMETGSLGGLPHSNKYQTSFAFYEVERYR